MIICDKCVHKMSCIDYGTKTDQCKYCDPMTNDEWRKTCSTEEFAEFLCNVGFENETIVRKFKSEWVVWLKQPHTNKER